MRIRFEDSRRPGAAGFTLLEILVALAIFATVMTVVFAALIHQQRSLVAQENRNEVRNRLRHGIDVLEKELTSAGGGLPVGPPVSAPGGLGDGSPLFLCSGLGVTDGGPDGPDILTFVRALSPAGLLTRGMETASSPLSVDGGIRWSAGMVGIISDGTDAELFRVTRVDGGGLLQHGGGGIFRGELSKAYAREAFVARILLAGYAVEVPHGRDHPALVRREIGLDGNLRVRTVAEGIEDLQVRLRMRDGTEEDAGLVGPDSTGQPPWVGVRVRLVSRGRVSGSSGVSEMEAVVSLRNLGRPL